MPDMLLFQDGLPHRWIDDWAMIDVRLKLFFQRRILACFPSDMSNRARITLLSRLQRRWGAAILLRAMPRTSNTRTARSKGLQTPGVSGQNAAETGGLKLLARS